MFTCLQSWRSVWRVSLALFRPRLVYGLNPYPHRWGQIGGLFVCGNCLPCHGFRCCFCWEPSSGWMDAAELGAGCWEMAKAQVKAKGGTRSGAPTIWRLGRWWWQLLVNSIHDPPGSREPGRGIMIYGARQQLQWKRAVRCSTYDLWPRPWWGFSR